MSEIGIVQHLTRVEVDVPRCRTLSAYNHSHRRVDVEEIEEISVKNWEDFVENFRELREKAGAPIVLRGQENASWPLQSTLERTSHAV